MKSLPLCLATVFVATAGVFGAEKVNPGLKPGETVAAFNVLDITGPNKGKKLCYR